MRDRITIGGLFFDAVFLTNHEKALTKTAHPVEYGADITDHAFLEPDQVSFEIGMSDVVSGDGSSINMYNQLRQMQANRQPITVVTRLKTYENMLITALSAPDDYATMFALKATIALEEIILVHTGTVAVQPSASAQPHKTNATENGTQQPINASPPATAPAASPSAAAIEAQARAQLYGDAA